MRLLRRRPHSGSPGRSRPASGFQAIRRRPRRALDKPVPPAGPGQPAQTRRPPSLLSGAGILALLLLPGVAAAQEMGMVERIISHLGDRPSGPMALRFIIQPVVATLLAFRDGTRDARTGRSPYFWTVLSNPEERGARLREGFKATAKVIGLGLALDVIYQVIVFKRFYPGEAILVSLIPFAFYLVLRGPFARLQALRLERNK